MNITIITFSKEGFKIANLLKKVRPTWSIYAHKNIASYNGESNFESINEIIESLFHSQDGIIFIGPCGIAVRSIAPYLSHKTTDPAVVVVDAGGRFAISLLSGHEGGANDLCIEVASVLGAEPCISTTTEAVKTITAGIGCRKGTSSNIITEAIENACTIAGISVQNIRTISTAQIKSTEQGLIDACKVLNIPLRILHNWQIKRCTDSFSRSDFVEEVTGLPAIAEPAALVSGRDSILLLRKHIYQGVTIALAKERCLWSE